MFNFNIPTSFTGDFGLTKEQKRANGQLKSSYYKGHELKAIKKRRLANKKAKKQRIKNRKK